MDKDVDRIRPEYLDPIGKPASGFPWLLVLGLAVAALAVLGAKQHMDTLLVWQQRFLGERPSVTRAPAQPDGSRLTPGQWAQRQQDDQRIIDDFRQRRASQMQQPSVQPGAEADVAETGLRCLNGVLLRRIPGGWENIPGQRC